MARSKNIEVLSLPNNVEALIIINERNEQIIRLLENQKIRKEEVRTQFTWLSHADILEKYSSTIVSHSEQKDPIISLEKALKAKILAKLLDTNTDE